jgi:hypothetical protein
MLLLRKVSPKKILVVFVLIIGFNSYGQDYIITHGGEMIECKIVDLNDDFVVYNKFKSEDTSEYSMLLSLVQKIRYQDGTEHVVSKKIMKKSKHTFIGLDHNGMYVDFLTGQTGRRTSLGVGARFGSRWYFGSKSSQYRKGIQVQWVKYMQGLTYSDVQFSFFHVGYASIYKFDQSRGVELNLNTGYSRVSEGFDFIYFNYFVPKFFGGDGRNAISINPSIKFRYESWAIGIDYDAALVSSDLNRSAHNLCLTFGYKFDKRKK